MEAMRFFLVREQRWKILKWFEIIFDKKTELKIYYGSGTSSLSTPKKNKRLYLNSPHTLIDYGGHTEKLWMPNNTFDGGFIFL